MGLFGKKEMCSICNTNEASKKLIDGCICNSCAQKSSPFILTLSWKNYTVDKVKRAITASGHNAELLRTYHPTKKIEKYISFDENNKLWNIDKYNIIFKYEDIINYELLEDGESITKGGIGGAVVGGVLFGGVGALTGSVIGKKKTKKEINEFRIKIITRNEFYPEVYIQFLTTGSVKSGSLLYNGYKNAAQRIITEFAVILDTQNNADKTGDETVFTAADEIVKYKKLFDDGIITQEEFESKKKQLLGL